MSEKNSFWTLFPSIAGTFATLLSGAALIFSNQAKGRVDALQAQLSVRQEERRFAQIVMDRYDQVITAQASDPQLRIDRLAGLTTLALMINDEDDRGKALKSEVLKTISQQAQRYLSATLVRAADADPNQVRTLNRQAEDLAEIRDTALKANDQLLKKAAVADAQSPAVQTPVASRTRAAWGGNRVDVFYCTGGDAARERLDAANRFAALQKRIPSAALWRVRALDPKTNSRLGYQIFTNQIRVNTQAERAVAERMSREASLDDLSFQVVGVNKNTPGYISVFACEGAPRA